MNVSPQAVHAAPGAPLTQPDVSVVQDSGILTNVQAPSLTRILNPTAIALDNPAGTGAAFDKKDQVYKVYQRWSEKSTTINGSITAGSELIRISLNPMTLPQRLLDWVKFHRSCIPAIDVAITIGGAAGTISWLVLGWIPDDSEEATLDSVQQISCEHINMNNTNVLRFCLNDNRKTGLFRTIPDDGEKWPAMVLLVNHPALNVQRNDDVNYPIDVYVRFAPNAIFMEPFNVLGSDDLHGSTIDLSYYLKLDTVDILIGSQNVNNTELEMITLPDFGWNTGNFSPIFDVGNLLCARQSLNFTFTETALCYPGENIPEATFQAALDRTKPEGKAYPVPLALCFGFGTVPQRLQDIAWPQNQGQPGAGYKATVYTIQPLEVFFGMIKYICERVHVYEFGVIFEFAPQYRTSGKWMIIEALDQENPNMDYVSLPFFHQGGPIQHAIYQRAPKDTGLEKYERQVGLKGDGKYEPKIQFNMPGTPKNRFYTYTFVQTGNASASSALPTGLSTISIIRPGTTTTISDTTAFWPIMAPDLRGAKRVLEDIRERLATMWLAFEVEVNSQSFGTVVYAEGVMACRSSTPRQIRTGMPRTIVARNIRAIANPSAIPGLNTEGFTNWWSTSLARELNLENATFEVHPRFANIPMQKEAAGFALAAGAGLTNGLMDFYQLYLQNEWAKAYQDKQIKASLDLAKMRNQNMLDLDNQKYRNALSLKGFSGPSANNAAQADFGHINTNASNSVGTNTSPILTSFANTQTPTPNPTMDTGMTTDISGLHAPGTSAAPPAPPMPAPPAWTRGAVPTPFLQAGYEGPKSQKLPEPIDEEDVNVGPTLEETLEFIRGGPGRQPTRRQTPAPVIPPRNESLPAFSRDDETRQAFRLKNNQPGEPIFEPPEERLIGERSNVPSPLNRTALQSRAFRVKNSELDQKAFEAYEENPSLDTSPSPFKRSAPERQAIRVNNSELDQLAFEAHDANPIQGLGSSPFVRGGRGRVPVRMSGVTRGLVDLEGIPQLR